MLTINSGVIVWKFACLLAQRAIIQALFEVGSSNKVTLVSLGNWHAYENSQKENGSLAMMIKSQSNNRVVRLQRQ